MPFHNGIRNPPVGILKVEDKAGTFWEEYHDGSNKSPDKNIALAIAASFR